MDIRSPAPRLLSAALALALMGTPAALASGDASGKGGERRPGSGAGDDRGADGSSGDPDGEARATPGSPIPKGVTTAGFAAGRGVVEIREYIDLGDRGDVSVHLDVVPTLLSRVVAKGVGSIIIRPLVVGRDRNSMEAAGAVIAASRQNRAWPVVSHLVRARLTRTDDWVTPASLATIARAIGGLTATRFVGDATSRAIYPQLNAIRRAARSANVTVTPAFVVKGPRGTRVVSDPPSARPVLDAIESVR